MEDPVVKSTSSPREDRCIYDLIESKLGDRYTVIKRSLGGLCCCDARCLVIDKSNGKQCLMHVCDKSDPLYTPDMRAGSFSEFFFIRHMKHPSIPKVCDVVEDDDALFIVLECIYGDTLEKIVETNGAQPVDKVIEWGRQICEMLLYLKGQSSPVFCLNLNPRNLLLTSDGIIKLVDLVGLCTRERMLMFDSNTRGYAAPERYGCIGSFDVRTEIYELGATLYCLVTGINPEEPPYEILPIRSVDPSLPEGVECIILKCTERNPDKRYQSLDKLVADLNCYQMIQAPKPKGIIEWLFGKK